MSREVFMAEARQIEARAQAEARAAMLALYQQHFQRLEAALGQIAAAAARNGVRVNPQGFILPDTRQVLKMDRPSQVYNISY